MTESKTQNTPLPERDLRPLLETITQAAKLLEKKFGDDSDLSRLCGAASDLAGMMASESVTAAAPDSKNVREEAIRRRRVLYIEDDPVNFGLIEATFKQLRPDFEALAAATGQAGIDLAPTINPDLILLDLDLPDIHGSEVLRQLQQNPSTASTPVVVLSADATASQIERLLSGGARNYLIKPFDLVHFLAVVDEILEKAA